MLEIETELLDALKELGVGVILTALDKAGYRREKIWMKRVKPLTPGLKMAGTSVTVKYLASREPPSREDYVHTFGAIDNAKHGNVLVLDGEGRENIYLFGEMMAVGCVKRGISGVVIDGGCHDIPDLKKMGFPTFAIGVAALGSKTYIRPVANNVRIQCGGVQVDPGDVIVGDDDGVVVVPKEKAEEVLKIAKSIKKIEQEFIEKLQAGVPYLKARES